MTRCESTQDALRREPLATHALATFEQTSGRGRRGRQWISPPQASLALSWRANVDHVEIEDLPLISLAVGVGLFQWIERLTEPSSSLKDLHLKWPNDLLFEGRKLAGILCEAAVYAPKRREVIVGIGVNLTQDHKLPPQSAALHELNVAEKITQERLKAESTQGLMGLISLLEASVDRLVYDRNTLLNEWRERALPLGTALSTGGQLGQYRGITDQGALQLDIGGRLLTVESGEVDLVGSLY